MVKLCITSLTRGFATVNHNIQHNTKLTLSFLFRLLHTNKLSGHNDIDAKLPFTKIEPQVSVCCIRINLKLWIWICRAQLRLILHLLLWRFGPTRIFASLMHRLQNSLSLALFFHGLTFRRLTASSSRCIFPSHFFVFNHISIIHIFRPLDPSSFSYLLCFETIVLRCKVHNMKLFCLGNHPLAADRNEPTLSYTHRQTSMSDYIIKSYYIWSIYTF